MEKMDTKNDAVLDRNPGDLEKNTNTEEMPVLDKTVINDDVILTITETVLSGISGLTCTSSGLVADLRERLGKKAPGKGIKIRTDGEKCSIEITIIVDYGIKIPEVSAMIQQEVRRAVEDMAGKVVQSVDIIVEGIRLPSEKVEKELSLPQEAGETKKKETSRCRTSNYP